MRFEHVQQIGASADTVWRLTTDIERLPSITPTITSVRRFDAGPLRVGSAARLKQPAQRSSVWTVTVLDEPRHFEWETKVLGSRMIGTHIITAHGEGCTNTLIIEMRGFAGAILGRIAGARIRAALAIENAAFKQHAEPVK